MPLAAGAKEKAGRGISSPARPFYWPTVALLPVPRGLGLVSATAEQHQSHSQERERGQRHDGRGYAGLGELANRLHDGRGRRWNVRVGELGSGSGGCDHAGDRGQLVPDGIPLGLVGLPVRRVVFDFGGQVALQVVAHGDGHVVFRPVAPTPIQDWSH